MRRNWGVVTMLLLAGCSNLTSERVAVGVKGKTRGVPFTLNKPQMSVVRTPGKDGAPDAYAITTSYVPDPEQRYLLQITPNLLSDVDWTMTFDAQGSLTDTNAKLTNETPAVLKSLATLAATLAVLDVAKLDEEKTAKDIRADLLANLNGPSPRLFDERSGTWKSLTHAEALALKPAATAMLDRLVEVASFGKAASAFSYTSLTERQLLFTALHLESETRIIFPEAGCEAAKTCTRLSEVLSLPNDPLHPRAAEIVYLYDKLDRAKLKAINAQEKKLRRNLYGEWALTRDEQADTAALKASQGVTTMAGEALGAYQKKPRITLLLDILDRSEGGWQKALVASLDTKIAARRAALRLGATPGALPSEAGDADLLALRRQRAAILGVLPEVDRRDRIQRLLTNEANVGKYKDLSDEIAFLDKKVADAEAGLTPATPEPVADAPETAAYMVADDAYTAAIINDRSKWITDKLKHELNRPQYVVVVIPPVPPKASPAKKETARQAPEARNKPPAPPPAAQLSPAGSDVPGTSTPVIVPQPKEPRA